MRLPRSSGILLHPTSLPSPFGVGDLGPATLEFIGLLAETGQRWWQLLPLGPTGYGNSPYQSYSSHAGNPLLISPERLADDGLLKPSDWADYPELPEDRVDYDAAIAAKEVLLRKAFANFGAGPPAFRAFAEDNAGWLDDHALFMALKGAHGGSAWYDWEPGLVRRDPAILEPWRKSLDGEIRYHQFAQYLFDRQWKAVRAACEAKRIGLFGDLPIFVARDSVDVWARPDLFWLDERGHPTVVAGVPPDYFAETGQLWGNPLYRWDVHQEEKFAWWIGRLKAQLARVDLVRLDHFRGFRAYWEVPAAAPTAEKKYGSKWVEAPGEAFLTAVHKALGGLPLVAEDLGEITEDVYALRDQFHLPGMRVMIFGLDGTPGTEFHLPYSYANHSVAYTGTHDNPTILGWFSVPPHGTPPERAFREAQIAYAKEVINCQGDEVHWDAIRAVMSSVADTVIVPLQDILGLGNAARMNTPGHPRGNWFWRARQGQVRPHAKHRLATLTSAYNRWNGTPPPPYQHPTSPGPAHDPTMEGPEPPKKAKAAKPRPRRKS